MASSTEILNQIADGTLAIKTSVGGGSEAGTTPTGSPVRIGAVYNATPPTYGNGQTTNLQSDANGNLKQNLATKLDIINDGVSAHEKGWGTVNLTASGQILSAAGTIHGFFVNSTSSGTVRIANNTAGGSGFLGGVITPAAGTFYKYPAQVSVGGYITITGTIDVTFFVRQGVQA